MESVTLFTFSNKLPAKSNISASKGSEGILALQKFFFISFNLTDISNTFDNLPNFSYLLCDSSNRISRGWNKYWNRNWNRDGNRERIRSMIQWKWKRYIHWNTNWNKTFNENQFKSNTFNQLIVNSITRWSWFVCLSFFKNWMRSACYSFGRHHRFNNNTFVKHLILIQASGNCNILKRQEQMKLFY